MDKRSESPFTGGRQVRTVGLAIFILLGVIVLAASASTLSASLNSLIVTDVNVTVGLDSTADGESNNPERVIGQITNDSGRAKTVGEYIRFKEMEDNIPPDYETHFVVESEKPSYWRLTAYDRYEINGWAQARTSPVHEIPPGQKDRAVLSHEVTMKSAAVVVPSAFRPVNVVNSPDIEINNDGEGGLHLEEAAEPGDTFLLTSIRPTTDPSVLRQASTNYDREVQQRYTSLPLDMPDIIDRKTSTIVDAENSPYAKAVAIESWFHENYNYKFDVSPPDSEVTAELLTNRSTANSKYFATAMTVMLRSEGIPTRYAVGYTAGEPDPNNGTFLVRGIHTHSWVEVYFPEHGWVPFDPTPPEKRTEELSQLIDNASADSLFANSDSTILPERNAKTELITGEETREDGESDDSDERDDTEETNSSEGVVGSEETNSSEGVVGSEETNSSEYINNSEATNNSREDGGESDGGRDSSEGVGEGDDTGESNPYQLILLGDPVPGTEVAVQLKNGTNASSGAVIEVGNSFSGRTNDSGIHTFEVPFKNNLEVGGYKGPTEDPSGLIARKDPEAMIEQDLPTELMVSVDGPVQPGSDVTTEVTIEGEPVENADIRIDEALIDRTNRDGKLTHPLPSTSNNVTIVAGRGAARGEQMVELADISVSINGWPAVLPGYDATATVTYGSNTPVSNVTIATDGTVVGTTDEDGTINFSPAFKLSETVTATQGEMSASTEISPLWNLLIGLAGFTLLVMILGFGTRLAGISLTRMGRSVAATITHSLLIAVIQFSQIVDRLWQSMRQGAGSRIEWFATMFGRSSSGSSDNRGSQEYEQPDESPGLVREAWWRLVSLTPVSKPETRTPGEIAEVAKRSGFPRRAVNAILEAFRIVQYGNQDPEQYTEEDIETAMRSIEDE